MFQHMNCLGSLKLQPLYFATIRPSKRIKNQTKGYAIALSIRGVFDVKHPCKKTFIYIALSNLTMFYHRLNLIYPVIANMFCHEISQK